MNLLVWQDARGQIHAVNDLSAWQIRRQQILADMQLVMGPLPPRGGEAALAIQVLQTETLPTVTRQKISYAGPARAIAFPLIC